MDIFNIIYSIFSYNIVKKLKYRIKQKNIFKHVETNAESWCALIEHFWWEQWTLVFAQQSLAMNENVGKYGDD